MKSSNVEKPKDKSEANDYLPLIPIEKANACLKLQYFHRRPAYNAKSIF